MRENPVRVQMLSGRASAMYILIYVAIVLFMANLNALTDLVLHPEIPYFDKEHLVVGGITGLVSAVLFALLFLQNRRLRRALHKIRKLESILPICTHCRKIRRPGSNSEEPDAWVGFETYVTEQTDSLFSHGICPECFHQHYPELALKQKEKRQPGPSASN